ncbi:TPA: AAA family ATPase, partial [Listeria monocytogenes]|nr:AAA family ATPase [Listeria monocytogenes]
MGNIIKNVHITTFRKLSNLEFNIGRNITVLSGHNGVGKSSLLSVIASVSGTNNKRNDGQKFQPDFVDYFHIDPKEKYLEYDMSVGYENEGIKYPFHKGVRFKNDTKTGRGIRPLPKTVSEPNSGKTNISAIKELKEKLDITESSRVPMPTIYLSLARLYPTGESDVKTTEVRKNTNIYQKKYYEKYREWYNAILPNSISTDSKDIFIMTKEVTENSKLFMGLNNSTAQTQSVGQDNLGSIISALVDFYALSLLEDYDGGVLFIDEIEASLHPSALTKLFTLLDQLSDYLKLQILVTSHSLTILKNIIIKQKKDPEKYQLIYLKGQRDPNVTQYIDYLTLKADLFDDVQSIQPTITIYCEDSETKQLFEMLINIAIRLRLIDPLPNYDILPIYIGKDQLEGLPKYDSHFRKVLIVLDGDAKSKNKTKIEEWINNNNFEKSRTAKKLRDNIVSLPGFLSPEGFLYKIIYTYCKRFIDHQNFWRSLDASPDLTNYTSERVEEMFVFPDNEVNLDKLKSNSKDMLTFCEQSQIIYDYYNGQN